jgi:hypothetical protein
MEQLKVLILVVPNAPFIYNWHNFCPHSPHPSDLDLQVFVPAYFFNSFVLNFESSGLVISISKQVFGYIDQKASIWLY